MGPASLGQEEVLGLGILGSESLDDRPSVESIAPVGLVFAPRLDEVVSPVFREFLGREDFAELSDGYPEREA